MRRIFCCFGFLLFAVPVFCQPGSLQLGYLIDVPSTKTLESGGFVVELRMYPNGGLLASSQVGLTNRFSMGVSYGGENIIGNGKVNLNPEPHVHLRYLVIAEQFLAPAILIGFNSQGYGGYDKKAERYTVKSRGLYAAVSKNTSFLGGIGFHGGANWSLENKDGDKDPNFFIGCHKWISEELVALVEYDAAVNDNSDNAIGSGKGYLNAGIRWSVAQTFFVEFSWKNILENRENVSGSSREIKLIYLNRF
jgi:hypothetical protein